MSNYASATTVACCNVLVNRTHQCVYRDLCLRAQVPAYTCSITSRDPGVMIL